MSFFVKKKMTYSWFLLTTRMHSRMSLLDDDDDDVRLNRYTHPHSSDSDKRLIKCRASVLPLRPISASDERKKKKLCNEHGRKLLRKRICCHLACDIISTFIRYYCQLMDNENSMTCRKPAMSVH